MYAVNATDGQLLVSADSGHTWARHRPPGAVLDLVLNPDNPDHTIAAGERELYVSRDGGKTWRPSAAGRAGLLTWTSGDALFVIDERSAVQRSTDAGASWQMIGEVGG